MQLIRLALKNIRGSGFRSVAIFLAVMGMAGFLLATTLIIAGARYSLDSGLERLGADILVVPEGAEIKIETALLVGKPVDVWMPRANLQKVANIPRGGSCFLSNLSGFHVRFSLLRGIGDVYRGL